MLRLGAECKLTQKQANKYFENPGVNIAKLHATTMLLFLMTVFYLPLLPVAPVIGLGGTIFSYVVEKYLLLRRHKMPEQFGPSMSRFFLSLVPYAMVVYALSSFLFSNRLAERVNLINLISLVTLAIFFLLPVERAITRCCLKGAHRSSEDTYEKSLSEFGFYSDYDIANPMTHAYGLERRDHMIRQQEEQKEQEQRKSLMGAIASQLSRRVQAFKQR